MNFKPKNRDWVKNAAIIFLAVLLVLTFFSNTIMNRSLPEVATQQVTDGSIVAKVRGTGTVTAAGTHVVKAEQTREIRSVMVKAGQEVSTGDVLFILGEGESEELEAAQENLRVLQLSYQRAALGYTAPSYEADEHAIQRAREDLTTAKANLTAVQNKAKQDGANIPSEQKAKAEAALTQAEAALEEAKQAQEAKQAALADAKAARDMAKASYDTQLSAADTKRSEAQTTVDDLESQKAALNDEKELLNTELGTDPTPERVEEINERLTEINQELLDIETELTSANEKLTKANSDYHDALEATATVDEENAKVAEAQKEYDQATDAVLAANDAVTQAKLQLQAIEATIEEILGKSTVSEELMQAKADVRTAEDTLFQLETALQEKKAADAKSAALTGIDLTDISQQIERAKEKLRELSGGEDNQIVSKVNGVVQSVSCTSGDTKAKDDVLCTIEVPDMGYTLSFSVTNDQARRLKLGDTGTVSNYYWGNEVTATLSTIAVDPKNPQTNKLLTFDLSGDVNAGADLTLSVGQKSANYDVIIPNSSIRSDANGSFVLAVEARNSPLGNRYVAKRVNVEVLAADDVNSAVTGDLSWGDYVITTSNAPVKSGELVRLADNS